MTLPFARYDTVDGQSVNIIDQQRAGQVWQAIADDELGDYLSRHPDDELEDPRQVS